MSINQSRIICKQFSHKIFKQIIDKNYEKKADQAQNLAVLQADLIIDQKMSL